jgi:hypothetical protein
MAGPETIEGLEDEDGWHVASGAVQLLPGGRQGLVLVVLADGQPTAEGGFALTSAPATIAIQEVANLR